MPVPPMFTVFNDGVIVNKIRFLTIARHKLQDQKMAYIKQAEESQLKNLQVALSVYGEGPLAYGEK